MNYKGQYTTDLLYSPGDVVFYGGNSFVARKMVRGEQPSNSSVSWGLLAVAGNDGKQGAPGQNGTNGNDGAGIPDGGLLGQVLCKASSADLDVTWSNLSAASVNAAERSHLHGIDDVLLLEEQLNGKAAKFHAHTIDAIDGLRQSLSELAKSQHTHDASEIYGRILSVEIVDAESINAGGTIISPDSISTEHGLAVSVSGVQRVFVTPDEMVVQGNARFGSVSISRMPCPQTSTSAGTAGDIRWDSSYLYLCVSQNSWKRVSLQDW